MLAYSPFSKILGCQRVLLPPPTPKRELLEYLGQSQTVGRITVVGCYFGDSILFGEYSRWSPKGQPDGSISFPLKPSFWQTNSLIFLSCTFLSQALFTILSPLPHSQPGNWVNGLGGQIPCTRNIPLLPHTIGRCCCWLGLVSWTKSKFLGVFCSKIAGTQYITGNVCWCSVREEQRQGRFL